MMEIQMNLSMQHFHYGVILEHEIDEFSFQSVRQ